MTPRQLFVARELAAGQPQIVQDRRCRTLRHCVSGDEQVESGLSLEAQEQIAHGFWQRNLNGKGLEWGGLWADEAVSAFATWSGSLAGRGSLAGCGRCSGTLAGQVWTTPLCSRREWSWESCQRAYAAFWTVLVEKEGTSWIADPIVKTLVAAQNARPGIRAE